MADGSRISGLLSALASGKPGEAILSQVSVRVRTSLAPILPEITVTPADAVAAASGPSAPSTGQSLLVRLLKPSVTVDTPLGSQTFAPAGEPSGELVPFVLGGLAVGVAGVAWLLGARGFAKRAALAGAGAVVFGELRRRGLVPALNVAQDAATAVNVGEATL